MLSLNELSAFMLGLLSTPHCLGMCGGIACLLGQSSREAVASPLTIPSCYLGRILCYMLCAVLVGSVLSTLHGQYQFLGALFRVASGLVLVIIAWNIASSGGALKLFERKFATLFTPFFSKIPSLLPINTIPKALLVGGLWGLVPCGLLYSVLMWASFSSNNVWQAATLMACFGLGTLPAMFIATKSVQTVFSKLVWRRYGCLALGLWGVVTIIYAARQFWDETLCHQFANLQALLVNI